MACFTSFSLEPGAAIGIYLVGIGTHGLCGHKTAKAETAEEITNELVIPLIDDLGLKAGEPALRWGR